MKSFITAAREEITEDRTLQFELASSDGKTQEQYLALPPTEAQVAVFAAAFGTDAPEKDRMAAVIDFLRGTLHKDDFAQIRNRLLDRNDELDFGLMVEIVGWLMEEMTAFPTQQSSDSTPSRAATGPRSTGRAPSKASTRSISAPGDSAI
jgi:hypothetical protein